MCVRVCLCVQQVIDGAAFQVQDWAACFYVGWICGCHGSHEGGPSEGGRKRSIMAALRRQEHNGLLVGSAGSAEPEWAELEDLISQLCSSAAAHLTAALLGVSGCPAPPFCTE